MFCRSVLLCLLVISSVAASAQSAAPKACPWVTKGSAARALGGEVSSTVNISDAREGSCTFLRSGETAAYLKIQVGKSGLPECGADSTKLKGIGNESMRCRLPGSSDEDAEMITGRVRDLYFTISIHFPRQRDAAKSTDPLDDELEHIAETVAGNLF